jgi:hypothetical protein
MPGINTLAYFAAASKAEKKGFITLIPGKKHTITLRQL